MPLECPLIAIANYAVVGQDDLLTLAGLVDTVTATLKTNGGTPPPAIANIPLPTLYLVFTLTGSIADGLAHEAEVGIRHEDGSWVIGPSSIGLVTFRLNPDGRPLRANFILRMEGLKIPAGGDYDVVLRTAGRDIAHTPLYVAVQVV